MADNTIIEKPVEKPEVKRPTPKTKDELLNSKGLVNQQSIQKHLGTLTDDSKGKYIVKHAILENKKLYQPGSKYAGPSVEKFLKKGQIRSKDK